MIIDLLGANLLGMTLGLYTLRFLETRTYDWNRQEESRKLTGSLVSSRHSREENKNKLIKLSFDTCPAPLRDYIL